MYKFLQSVSECGKKSGYNSTRSYLIRNEDRIPIANEREHLIHALRSIPHPY